MIPTLTIVRGPFKGSLKKIRGNSYSIGRADNNDFVIKDIHVSRSHCVIKLLRDGSCMLVDQSTSGTVVNGREINHEKVILEDQSTIGVGPVLLSFTLEPE